MVLLYVVAVAFLVGLLRGGKLSRMLTLPLRWPALPLAAFAAQAVVVYWPRSSDQVSALLPIGLLLLSSLTLVAVVWVNRRLSGMFLLGLGLILNLAVMVANGGYMPIEPAAVARIGHTDRLLATSSGTRVVYSKDVVLPREQTRLWLLSDVLVLPSPFPVPSAASIGDACIAVGAFLLVQRALLGPRSPRARSDGGPPGLLPERPRARQDRPEAHTYRPERGAS